MNSELIDKASRRAFVAKLAYVAPAIVSLAVAPSFAKAGSCRPNPTSGPSVCAPPKR
jgi:hypothetical protein